MSIRHNRVKVTANGTNASTNFTLGAAVPSFQSFSAGEVLYTALSEDGDWQVARGTVLGINLTRGIVEENHLGTTEQIDFSGKTIQIAQTLTADYMDDITSKLDGIDDGATGPMSDADVKLAYERNLDTNEFDDSEKAKLATVSLNATPDQTGSEIKSLYEAEPDTNAFDDIYKTKLDNIEDNATADMTDAEIKIAYELNNDTNAFDDAYKTKLDNIAENATGDMSDLAIKEGYERNADTNAYNDAAQNKLALIEAEAKDDQLASEVPFTPNATVLATDVQQAIEDIDIVSRTYVKPSIFSSYDPTLDPITDETLVQDALVDHGLFTQDKDYTATGLLTGGKIIASILTTIFSIEAGEGLFADNYTNPLVHVVPSRVSWDSIANIDITSQIAGLSVATVSVFLKLNGSTIDVVSFNGEVSNSYYKDHIYLGNVTTVDGVITGVNNSPIVAKQTSDTLIEVAVENINITDGSLSDVTGALSFWQNSGKINRLGINWHDTDHKNPNRITFPAVGSDIDPLKFNVINQAGIKQYTDIDALTAEYDLGGAVTAIPATKATIHRMYAVGSISAQRKFILLLGQTLYDDATLAKEGLVSDTITAPLEVDNMTLIAYIGVTAESTDFSDDTSAWLVSDIASIVGAVGGSGAVSWDDITGPISDNSDLQAEFDAKENLITPKNTAFNKNFGAVTDTVCEGNDTRLGNNKDQIIFNDVTGAEPAYAEGQMFYANGQFNIKDAVADTTMSIGHELWIKAHNATGVTITNGAMVKQIGVETGTPSIDLAQADDFSHAQVLGIATHDIVDGAIGNITNYGTVSEIPVNQDGETWLIGDTLFLSATIPGGITNVLPPIGSIAGILLTSNGVTGKLFSKISSLITLPPIGGWMKLILGTIAPIATAVNFTNFTDISASAGITADGVSGVYTLDIQGTYEVSFSVSFSNITGENNGSVIAVDLYNITTDTLLFGYNIIVGRNDTVASGSFTTQDDFLIGDQLVARFREVSGNVGAAVDVDSIAFVIKSILIR